jgi:uncharacterized protein RhaS with RHS repeats
MLARRARAAEEHYNYFRDYDPSIGRYVESDPIGLRAGLNSYTYVGGRPLSSIDIQALIEICRNIEQVEWLKVARDWKISEYEPLNQAGNYFEALFEILNHLASGGGLSFGGHAMIPIYRDIELDQKYLVRYQVCTDSCSGLETYRRRLGATQKKEFREMVYSQSGTKEGPPQFFMIEPRMTMKKRWRNLIP